MKDKLNNLIKLLLELHKALLDLEKVEYEKNNGAISNNYEYFQLVVSGDDFRWLRSLSELIASLDSESEKVELDYSAIQAVLENLHNVLQVNSDDEFSKRYHYFLEHKANLHDLQAKILISISDCK